MSKNPLPYRGRFAPSPTGPLHFGSLVAALVSWLQARANDGRWLLRIDDIDPPREVAGAAAQILHTLQCFGLEADEPPVYQSQRTDAYRQALDQLLASGQAFECRCSRRELAALGYHPTHCVASMGKRQQAVAYRVKVSSEAVQFVDAVQGPQSSVLSDTGGPFVVRRVDGLFAYQLATVVDDAWQGITEVVRGADLLDSTARQIWLQQCLELPTPHYAHLPLVLAGDGRKLSKSEAALPVDGDEPLPALQRALQQIGLEAISREGNLQQRLQRAVDAWSLDCLPQCSSFAHDPLLHTGTEPA